MEKISVKKQQLKSNNMKPTYLRYLQDTGLKPKISLWDMYFKDNNMTDVEADAVNKWLNACPDAEFYTSEYVLWLEEQLTNKI